MEKMTHINPKILIWARNESGTLIDDARSKFGQQKLASWESGSDYPSYSQLVEIADYYRKPVAVFFFPEPPKINNLVTSCRTLPQDFDIEYSRNFSKLLDMARVMQLNLYELNNNTNVAKNKLSMYSFDSFNIKETANKLRSIINVNIEDQQHLKDYNDAFEFWREKFYDLGIFVFKDAFKNEKVSGFCLYDEEFPIIYINNSFAFARQIFTLFHEIYHLIYKTSGVDFFEGDENKPFSNETNELIERYCNQFAGEFLVPEKSFYDDIRDKEFSEELVNQLAKKYVVSREVILRKFLIINKIDDIDYSYYRQKFLQDYYRIKNKTNDKKNNGNYYNTQMSYYGDRYMRLAFGSYYNKKITITQLSKYMNMKIPSLKTLAVKKGWGGLY